MYILRNAAANVLRNKGRNTIVFLITLMIIAVCCISFMIRNTTLAITKQYKEQFGSEVFIRLDMEKIQKESGQSGNETSLGGFSMPEEIAPSLYMEISKSDYLNATSFKNSMGAVSDTLAMIESKENLNHGGMSIQQSGGNDLTEYDDVQYMIYGASDVGRDINFIQKKREVVTGDFPKETGEVMISDELAKKNNLKIGDTIDVRTYIRKTAEGKTPASLSLKICGFYRITSTNTPGFYLNAPENDMYVNYASLNTVDVNPDNYLSASYFLKNPKDIDAFAKECYELGVSDKYVISTDTDTYNAIVGSVEELGNVTYIFLWFIVILGGALLILLSLLTNRERKYEVGVLRAMGMKKNQVARQIIYESLFIVIIAFCIGLPIGILTAQPIANTMMEKQNEKMNNLNGGSVSIITTNMNGSSDKIEKITVKIDITTLLQSCGIGILLIVLSSAMSILYITKYEPMRILSERS